MLDLLEACVRIRSLSGQEQVVAEFLRDQMNARGFHAHIDPAGNAVGVIGAGLRQLVLLGHMDTVDGIVPVRYENGALYGRGTVDAKGPLCAFILAAEQLYAASPELLGQCQIVVIGATEEEAASSKGARYAMAQYRPESCIIGEPSGADGITLGYKGRLLVYARFEQPSQHTAMPGASPAMQAIRLWNLLDEFAQRYNADKPRAFDQVLPTLRKIGSDDNGLLAWCDMLVSLRLPLEVGPQQMQEQIEMWCRSEHCAAARVTFSGHELAYRSSRDTPLARAFVDAIRAEGGRPAYKMKTGTADFNVVGPVWQCPMVAYGPGDSSLDHTPDEHVDVAEFERSVRILERALRDVIRSQS